MGHKRLYNVDGALSRELPDAAGADATCRRNFDTHFVLQS
jgi:hypothetical protein